MSEVLEAVNKLAGQIESKAVDTAKKIEELKAANELQVKTLEASIEEAKNKLIDSDKVVAKLSDDLKEVKAKGNRLGAANQGPTLKDELATMIEEQKASFAKVADGSRMEPVQIKAVGVNLQANLTGTPFYSYGPWQPGMEPIGQNRFRSLVNTIQSATDNLVITRANIPVGEGSFANQTEGSAKAQIDRDWTNVNVTLQTLAGYMKVSRQALRNTPFMRSWLPTSLLEQFLDQEDVLFTNALYAAASPNPYAGTRISQIVNQIAELKAKKYTPNYIAVSAAVWVQLILHTQTGAGYSLPNVVTVDAMGNVRILGIQVYQLNSLTGNQVIVGDFTKASIAESEGLTFSQTESDQDDFIKNLVTFRLERVEALAIFRPDAFIASAVAES